MTTLPPAPAPSSTESDTERRAALSTMTRVDPELRDLDATFASGRFEAARARRDSVVVVSSQARANVHVTVRTSPAPSADARTRSSLVAIQVACFADEDEEQATRIFDRHGNAVAWLSAGQPPQAAPSHAASRASEGEPRAAQDTLRCPREDVEASARPKLPRSSVALLALGLLACAVGLSFGLGTRREPVVQRLPVQTIVGSVTASPRAIESALAARPSASASAARRAPKPVPAAQADEQRPSARVHLDGLVLDVTASPWMEVQLDGRNVGTTPRKGLNVRRGVHDVVLVNRDLGLRTSVMLRADPGTDETQEISFE